MPAVEEGRPREGVGQLLVALILISLALILSMYVALWALGIVSRSTEAEALTILPNASLNRSTGELSILLHNKGSASVKVVEIAVQGRPCSPRQPSSGFPVEVRPGDLVEVRALCDPSILRIGVQHDLKILTASGNVYVIKILAS